MRVIGNIIKGVVAFVMIFAVLAVGVLIFFSVRPDFGTASGNNSGQPIVFTIQPGDSVATISNNLQQEGLIDSPLIFRLRLRLSGAENKLKAGQFQLTPGTDMDKLIATLSTPPNQVGLRFTVIEGMRLGEMADKLSKEKIVDAASFMQLANTPDGAATYLDDFPFLKDSGKPADQGLEGYLFPDTYEIKQTGNDNSDAAIRKMLETMDAKITPEMKKTVADRQLNLHQVLTIASIVQREAQVKEEFPIIAGVFWNRISNDMRLDADPTTQYAVSKPGDWWPTLNLDPNTVDNPYNTYKIQGLPPGPICNPGMDAIRAAIYPDSNDYLFFVAKNDGTGAHAFAKTLEEHERNRKAYGNK